MAHAHCTTTLTLAIIHNNNTSTLRAKQLVAQRAAKHEQTRDTHLFLVQVATQTMPVTPVKLLYGCQAGTCSTPAQALAASGHTTHLRRAKP